MLRIIRSRSNSASALRSAIAAFQGTQAQRVELDKARRIAVNRELESLDKGLECLPNCLRSDGRFAIISFHSLEDRRVKHAFREDTRLEVLTKKPIRPGDHELEQNPRSRSSRLRVARRMTV